MRTATFVGTRRSLPCSSHDALIYAVRAVNICDPAVGVVKHCVEMGVQSLEVDLLAIPYVLICTVKRISRTVASSEHMSVSKVGHVHSRETNRSGTAANAGKNLKTSPSCNISISEMAQSLLQSITTKVAAKSST